MPVYRHDTWNTLRGAVVEIRKSGTTIRTGLVEDVMPDSSALWIAAHGLTGRVLIEAAEGHEVWVEPKQLKGTRAYRMTWSALHPDAAGTGVKAPPMDGCATASAQQ